MNDKDETEATEETAYANQGGRSHQAEKPTASRAAVKLCHLPTHRATRPFLYPSCSPSRARACSGKRERISVLSVPAKNLINDLELHWMSQDEAHPATTIDPHQPPSGSTPPSTTRRQSLYVCVHRRPFLGVGSSGYPPKSSSERKQNPTTGGNQSSHMKANDEEGKGSLR